MINTIYRTLNGTYYSGNNSIVFDANPYVLANSALTLYFTDNDARYSSTVASVSGNTAVVDYSNAQYDSKHVTARALDTAAGFSGAMDSFTWGWTNYPAAVLQVTSTGGSSNVTIQVSADANHWINVASLAVTTANSNTAYTTLNNPWPYGRVYVNDIASGKSLKFLKAV